MRLRRGEEFLGLHPESKHPMIRKRNGKEVVREPKRVWPVLAIGALAVASLYGAYDYENGDSPDKLVAINGGLEAPIEDIRYLREAGPLEILRTVVKLVGPNE